MQTHCAHATCNGRSCCKCNADQIALSPWVNQFQGIALAQADFSSSVAYVDRVDLKAPGIHFTTTPASDPLETTSQTTSQFLQSSGAQVAINANFFAPCCDIVPEPKTLIGLAVSNGAVISPQTFGTRDAAASLFLSQTNQASVYPPNISGSADLSHVYNAVSGNLIVTDGVNTSAQTSAGAPPDPFGLDPRAGAGLSQNNQYLYLIVVDGRQRSYSVGVTTSDEAALMLDLGVYNGINLDGGGSTALVESDGNGGTNLIDRPSAGAERYDGNNFGVFANPLAAPEPSTFLAGSLAVLVSIGLVRRRSH